eukprot:CAMPEP_0180443600 /NCGR_PEP_ID=MMETSP1036_2-20121128/14761_1 /TAXON_ID=632150 /ORGANISM="Azadinium spinosum, Strain 3D9" /LENGTH=254 /DNA_ID=CAMNT_0022449923 /DNA_START=14 /DNA_END=778 /DNA_ORIENTATION=-
MPREEQRRLGVDQQQRRREDVLAPCRVLPQGGRGGGSASSTAPAIVPPLEAEGNASTDDKRQRQARCNVDITLRQEEAIRRLQSLREAQLASKERERLKRQWRAHKAQGYLLAQCKDAELRGYLASKEVVSGPGSGGKTGAESSRLQHAGGGGGEGAPRDDDEGEIEGGLVEEEDDVHEETEDDAMEHANEDKAKERIWPFNPFSSGSDEVNVHYDLDHDHDLRSAVPQQHQPQLRMQPAPGIRAVHELLTPAH